MPKVSHWTLICSSQCPLIVLLLLTWASAGCGDCCDWQTGHTRGSRQLLCCVPRHAGHGNLRFLGTHTDFMYRLWIYRLCRENCRDAEGTCASAQTTFLKFLCFCRWKVVDFFHCLWNNHCFITKLILGYILHFLLIQEAQSSLGCSPRVEGPSVLQDKVYETLPHGPAESGASPRHHSAELGDHTQAQKARLQVRR